MRTLLTLTFTIMLAAPASGANLQDQLNARWRGAWVLVKPEISSDCGGLYTNNRVSGTLVHGGGHHRLPAGELVQVHKVDLKKRRLDLLVDVEESLLHPYEDGPFALYSDLRCKVEFEIELSARPKNLGLEHLEDLLTANFERHERREDALQSPMWNRRQREPYPAGYEDIVADYRVWKAGEINQALGRRVDDALEHASRLLARVDDDPEFGAGLAHGIEHMADERLHRDCERLLESSFHTYRENAPSQSSRAWEDGFELGQDLAYHVELARRLGQCRVWPEDIDV